MGPSDFGDSGAVLEKRRLWGAIEAEHPAERYEAPPARDLPTVRVALRQWRALHGEGAGRP